MLLVEADAPPATPLPPSLDTDSTFSTWARFPESKRELNSNPTAQLHDGAGESILLHHSRP